MPKTNPIFNDPFVPVMKMPLSLPDGNRASRSAIVVDPNGANYEAGVVSGNYQLVPNETVQNVALDVLSQTGLGYEEGSIIFDGKKYRQRWLIDQFALEPRVGDIVRLTVDAFNSYDGSSLFGLSFNAQRLICGNGMIVDFLLGSYRFRHFGQNAFRQEIDQASGMVLDLGGKIGMLTGKLKHLTDTPMNRDSIQATFKVLNLPAGLQADVFMGIEEDNLWGLYNSFTRSLTESNSHRAEGINRQVGKFLLGGRS